MTIAALVMIFFPTLTITVNLENHFKENFTRGAGILVIGHTTVLLETGWQEKGCSWIDCSAGLNLACRLRVAQLGLTPVGDIIVSSPLNLVP